MSSALPPDFPGDPENPYAPPLAELRARPDLIEPVLGTTIPPTVDAVLSRAWQIYKARLGICLAIVLGALGLNWAFSFLLNMFVVGLTVAKNPISVVNSVQIVGTLVGIVLQLWLTIGQTVALLKIAKGHDVEFSTIFTGGAYLLSTIGAAILYGLAVLGIGVVCMVPGGALAYAGGGQGPAMIIALVVGGLIVFIAVIVISLRLSQFTYLIVDRDAGAIESLTLSNRITAGREGQIFLVGLLSVAINLGGFMACLVGVLFTAPLTLLMLSVLYLALTGQPTALGPGEQYLKGVKPLADSDFV